MNKIFSFDAETNGLWGQAFAIAAIVYDENGMEMERFIGRCPISEAVDGWVKENVIPQIAGIRENYSSYEEMLAGFAEFYLANKNGSDIICHMGYIVETKVLRDMHELDLIGDWDGPYPMFDVSGNLQQAGYDATSVDAYAKKFGLQVEQFEGGSHNPLYDSAIAAVVYRHLMTK